MPNRAVVLSAGYAYRLREYPLLREFERIEGNHGGALLHILLRYIHVLCSGLIKTDTLIGW